MLEIKDLINKEIKYFKENDLCKNKPFKTCSVFNALNKFNIVDYLKNGLLISSFQIGSINNIDIYKNHYEFLNKETLNNFSLKEDYNKMSRSVISGYLHKDRAIKLYNMLNDNEQYIVTLSSIQIDLDFEFHFSDFTFKDNKPLYEEYKKNTSIIEKSNIYDDELYKKLFHIEESGFIGFVGNYENRLETIMNNGMNSNNYKDISEFVEIAIMDKRWGEYGDVFDVLLNSLKLV
jgi:hypothetical protein